MVASPSTYRLNMQKAAAISTVSWISASVAPAALAAATSASDTRFPLCCTAAAIPSRAFILSEIAARPASARTSCTSVMPPGNCAAA
jgi:hypothetical protein